MKTLSAALKRVRGNADTPPDVRRLLAKGLEPALRGLMYRWRFGEVQGLVFLGRSCRFLGARKLHLGRYVYIGDFSYVDAFSEQGVHLGDRVTLREFAWVQLTSQSGHSGSRLVVGDGTYIGPRSYLGAGGDIVIGKDCQIGGGCTIIAEEHEFKVVPVTERQVTRRGVSIGDGCWLGNNVTVLDGVSIGPASVIGAGSVVTRDVPAGSVAFGVPARVRK